MVYTLEQYPPEQVAMICPKFYQVKTYKDVLNVCDLYIICFIFISAEVAGAHLVELDILEFPDE